MEKIAGEKGLAEMFQVVIYERICLQAIWGIRDKKLLRIDLTKFASNTFLIIIHAFKDQFLL